MARTKVAHSKKTSIKCNYRKCGGPVNFLLLGDIANIGKDISSTRLLRNHGGHQIAFLQELESDVWEIPAEYLVQPEGKIIVWEAGFACVLHSFAENKFPKGEPPVLLWFDLELQVLKLKFPCPRTGYCFIYLDSADLVGMKRFSQSTADAVSKGLRLRDWVKG